MDGYTASLAYDPVRRCRRTVPGAITSSPLLDKFLGFISIITSILVVLYLVGMCLWLIPMVLLSKLLGKQNMFSSSSAKNISTSSSGSITAIKTLSARSQMYLQNSGGPDNLAPLLMSRLSLFGDGIPTTRSLSQVYLWLTRMNYHITKRIFADQLARWTGLPFGPVAFLQARTCWLDDCVEEFVKRHKGSKVNVVILGAGYDTRCYRMSCLLADNVYSYEVDTAPTQKTKQRLLREARIDTKDTVFVACDFEMQDWLEQLELQGFDKDLPTFIVWEGVTYYLPQATVEATLDKVASFCGQGSCIGFDYFDTEWVMSPRIQKATQKGGEPFLFGMTGDEPHQLVSSKGLRLVEHLNYKELINRYLPKHFDGRPVGLLNDFGGFVLAEKA